MTGVRFILQRSETPMETVSLPRGGSYSRQNADERSNRGWGDVKGIISKLDYLRALGVDIIWVSPSSYHYVLFHYSF